jgi:ABC-type antimicrobial peptide transport system permease subunit
MPRTSQEIKPLSAGKIVSIAWKGIRIRIWRSLLVTSGIILAISFLTYILCSDAFVRNLAARGSAELIERLSREGVAGMDGLAEADQRIQTMWMVGLALLISFVGIVNAMLISVTERFREIGTMKCLGALDRFVVRLFLLESTFQGIAGTAAGILLGLVLCFAEGWFKYGNDVWTLTRPVEIASLTAMCFATGVLLSVTGALYPARLAARMKPVDALRTEV